LESNVFTFARKNTIPTLYFPASNDVLTKELALTSKKIVSLLLTLHEYPYIRYSARGKCAGICKVLATFVEDDMKKIITKLTEWKADESRERGTLLICDRSIDPVAPLMHEFTFQSMLNDLLKVNGETVALDDGKAFDDLEEASRGERKEGKARADGKAEAPKKVLSKEQERKKAEDDEKRLAENTLVLSEEDPLWMEFRHLHVAQVMRDVTQKFRDFKKENKMAQLQTNTNDNSTVKEMLNAMKDFPKYKAMMKKYHKHITLAESCMTKVTTLKLTELGDFEQDMATGFDGNGEKVVVKNLKSKLVQMCQDNAIGTMEKLRLLMIYMISQGGIQESTRKALMKSIHVKLQRAVRNLEKLGVDLNTETPPAGRPKKKPEGDSKFSHMRFQPVVREILSQLVIGELSQEEFPYTSPPPPEEKKKKKGGGGKKGGRNWRKKKGEGAEGGKTDEKKDDEDWRPRNLCFMLGGVAFSEIRSTYLVAEEHKAHVTIGSTDTLTPDNFIRELAELTPKEFKHALRPPRGEGEDGADDNLEDSDEEGADHEKLQVQFEDGEAE